jgi:hypothetical protein
MQHETPTASNIQTKPIMSPFLGWRWFAYHSLNARVHPMTYGSVTGTALRCQLGLRGKNHVCGLCSSCNVALYIFSTLFLTHPFDHRYPTSMPWNGHIVIQSFLTQHPHKDKVHIRTNVARTYKVCLDTRRQNIYSDLEDKKCNGFSVGCMHTKMSHECVCAWVGGWGIYNPSGRQINLNLFCFVERENMILIILHQAPEDANAFLYFFCCIAAGASGCIGSGCRAHCFLYASISSSVSNAESNCAQIAASSMLAPMNTIS